MGQELKVVVKSRRRYLVLRRCEKIGSNRIHNRKPDQAPLPESSPSCNRDNSRVRCSGKPFPAWYLSFPRQTGGEPALQVVRSVQDESPASYGLRGGEKGRKKHSNEHLQLLERYGAQGLRISSIPRGLPSYSIHSRMASRDRMPFPHTASISKFPTFPLPGATPTTLPPIPISKKLRPNR